MSRSIRLFVSGLMISAAVLFFASMVESSEPAELRTPTGTIFGTLEMPEAAYPVPVALIIPGSGPTDRDGNNAVAGKNDSLKMLAGGLAEKGIASVRYDKRGIAGSMKAVAREEDLRFETYIDDAVLWGRHLRRDKRFGRLVIIGHSEGALIGLVACKRLDADGVVLIASPGENAAKTIERQLAKNLPPGLLLESRGILEKLKKGETVKEVSAELMALFRPSVQPYLVSWFRYDPADEISKTTVPVMVVQGTTDIQVEASDARRLAQANMHARLVIIDGMNHILKDVPDDLNQQVSSYNDPDLPVMPELIEKIATFFLDLDG